MGNPRIIAGKAKGMRLKTVPGDITRPITDRVKESLFNIISADIVASRFLDLFGGTGSVGIEALSRGADFVQFVDKNQSACSVIKENLQKCDFLENAKITRMDAFSFVQLKSHSIYDYIYVSPPQYFGIWSDMVDLLDSSPDILGDDGWVIVQINPKEYIDKLLTNLTEIDSRDYGSTRLIFYSRIKDD